MVDGMRSQGSVFSFKDTQVYRPHIIYPQGILLYERYHKNTADCKAESIFLQFWRLEIQEKMLRGLDFSCSLLFLTNGCVLALSAHSVTCGEMGIPDVSFFSHMGTFGVPHNLI